MQSDGGTFTFDGRHVPFRSGDSILTALVRAGIHPTGGGCLCCHGDCPHCVAIVDGVAYTRTCLTTPQEAMVAESHPDSGEPPLPIETSSSLDTPVTHLTVDVVVIGGGTSGRAAAETAEERGQTTLVLDAGTGADVIGIYAGPLVVAATAAGLIHAHSREVVVATGAAEIQPVVDGGDKIGIYTAKAATALADAGVDLGVVVAVGEPPAGLVTTALAGPVLRVVGGDKVEGVVIETDGAERTIECDSVTFGLGSHPRDALARMGAGLPVVTVGSAAGVATPVECPPSGVVCPCSNVTVEQLRSVWERGFREMELVKRSTLAGTGTCQGAACLPYLTSFLVQQGSEYSAPFTARPLARQVTVSQAAGGSHLPPIPRTPLDGEHRALGARMDRIGGWWRPWNYGDTAAEYAAVRHRVSIGDVSTLGKLLVAGPDAEAALQRIYPTDISTIRAGRSRYVLLLNERGYVFDDGLVARESDGSFFLTSTSGGASMTEMWLRDWTASFGCDVRLMNVTMSLGAINVTGPYAGKVLGRLGATGLPPFMGHGTVSVAGIECKVFRLSFTGEVSYELHHAANRSVELWRALLEAGDDLGLLPHGLQALEQLRLEKGHILVGVDSDFDSTPRRLDHNWAVDMDKEHFIGRTAVERTNRVPLDKVLAGLTMDLPAPLDGATIWNGSEYAGYVTSAFGSPTLGKAVMLGWVDLDDGALPETVTIEGRPATITRPPFYDRDGGKARD